MIDAFQLDLSAIRVRAEAHMRQGAGAYRADRAQVVEVLNQALATEIACVLRYKSQYALARSARGQTCAAEFLLHAAAEQQHADLLAERIVQLGGTPKLNPEGLADPSEARSRAEHRGGESLRDLITEDLVAERIAIETYAAIVQWLGDADPTSRRLMETLLQKEVEHVDDLATLLEDF